MRPFPLGAALLLLLSTCDLFKSAFTIANKCSHDIDRIVWTPKSDREYWFGDDTVWDSTLSENAKGIAINSSSTRDVEAGSSYIVFYFTDDAQRYRTGDEVTVEARNDVTFTIDDSTPIVPD